MNNQGKEYRIYDNNNNLFIVSGDLNNLICQKLLPNNTTVEPTEEELEFVIKELEEQLKEKKDVETKKTVEDYYLEIVKLINDRKLNTVEEINEYINSLNISENEKQELFSKTVGYFESRTNENEYTKFKERIFEALRRPRRDGAKIFTLFQVKPNATGEQLCTVTLGGEMKNETREMEKLTFYYTDELKKELIEPVLEEMVLKSNVIQNDYKQSADSFGYRSDYSLQTEDNAYANLINIEQPYAEKLHKKLNSLNNMSKVAAPSERDAMINDMKEEKQKEIDEPLKRVKKKDESDNSGKISNGLLYGILAAAISASILIQIIFLS